VKPATLIRSLGRTVATVRESQGMTRNQLSDKGLISQTALQKLETDATHAPSTRTLAHIASAFGMPLSELIRIAETTKP